MPTLHCKFWKQIVVLYVMTIRSTELHEHVMTCKMLCAATHVRRSRTKGSSRTRGDGTWGRPAGHVLPALTKVNLVRTCFQESCTMFSSVDLVKTAIYTDQCSTDRWRASYSSCYETRRVPLVHTARSVKQMKRRLGFFLKWMANARDDVAVVARLRLAGEGHDSPRLLPGTALCLPPFRVLDFPAIW